MGAERPVINLAYPLRADSTGQALDAAQEVFIRRMRVRRGRRQVRVSGEALRQQDVLGRPVEVGDGRWRMLWKP